MLTDMLAAQWTETNKAEVLRTLGFEAIDPELIRKAYSSYSTRDRRLLVSC